MSFSINWRESTGKLTLLTLKVLLLEAEHEKKQSPLPQLVFFLRIQLNGILHVHEKNSFLEQQSFEAIKYWKEIFPPTEKGGLLS